MKKTLISFSVFISLLIAMACFYYIGHISPLVFAWFICVLYLVAIPKNLFSPRNMIFGYYFLWYGLSPAFATIFRNYTFTTSDEKIAYMMLFFTYGVSMVFLTFCEEAIFKKNSISNEKKYMLYNESLIKKIIRISAIIVLASLVIFINKTGGITRWLVDSKMAFISRHGSGWIYLIFTHSLMMFSSAYGVFIYHHKKKISILIYLIVIVLLFPFIGSKSKVILMIFIVMGLFLIKSKISSKWTFISVFTAAGLFSVGIYQRNYTWMTLNDFIPYTLNYFNTYEMFVTLIKDFEPSLLKTILLPFNRVLMIFGQYIHVPFYDMSTWLTSIYYPSNWAVGATQQWPLEADLYMSFYFILGIPFLLLYLWWLAYAFNKAKQMYVAWVLIYIMEFTFIISHYRGGLILWWYFYLIPFYILVTFIYKKMKITTIKDKSRLQE